jgi:outer membrane lipoprotein-sorting protein
MTHNRLSTMKHSFVFDVFLFLLILWGSCSSAFAQKDAKAKELLDKSSETFARSESTSASFTLNIKNVKAKTAESFDGTILMKGDKFFLSTPETNVWFDGKTQWIYFKSNQEVNISEPKKEELQLMTPSILFSIYKKDFNYQYIGERTDIKGFPVYELVLIPQQKTDIKKMIIQLDKKNNLPVSIVILHQNEINNNIYINKYQTGQNYSDDTFVFDRKKYPDTEIIDLR